MTLSTNKIINIFICVCVCVWSEIDTISSINMYTRNIFVIRSLFCSELKRQGFQHSRKTIQWNIDKTGRSKTKKKILPNNWGRMGEVIFTTGCEKGKILVIEKTVGLENDDYTICNWCSWYNHQGIGTGTGGLGNSGTGGDYPCYSIVEIGQNTEKGPGDLRRLAVTQNPGENPSAVADVKNSQGVK